MIRADALNWHGYGGYTEMTAPSSKVCFTDGDESKRIIVQENLLQNYPANVDEICSTEEEKSEYTITEQKEEGGEVTYDVPNFNVSNVFECGRNKPDVSY